MKRVEAAAATSLPLVGEFPPNVPGPTFRPTALATETTEQPATANDDRTTQTERGESGGRATDEQENRKEENYGTADTQWPRTKIAFSRLEPFKNEATREKTKTKKIISFLFSTC